MMLFASQALALSCLWGAHSANVQGKTVGPDTPILVQHTLDAGGELDLQLRLGEQEVPVELVVHAQYAEVLPTQPLALGRYTLSTLDSGEVATFEVVASVDQAAVEPVIERAERVSSISEWGKTKGISLEMEPQDEMLHFEVQIAPDGDFDTARTLITQQSVFIGRGLCESTYPGYARSDANDIRVRTVDLNGDTSDWVEVTKVSGGCSTVPMGGLFLSLLVLPLFRRR